MGQICKNRENNSDVKVTDENVVEFYKDLTRFLGHASISINSKNEIIRESNSEYKKFNVNIFFSDESVKIFKLLEIIIKIIDTIQIIFKLKKKHKIPGLTLINFDHFYAYNNDLIYYYNEKISSNVDLINILNLKKHRNINPDINVSTMTNSKGFSLHQEIFESPKQVHEETKSSKLYLYYLKRYLMKLLENSGLLSVLKKDKERIKQFSNINSLKVFKYSLGNILFNYKEVKEMKAEFKLDYTFIKPNLDCVFSENKLKFIMHYDNYSLLTKFENDIINNPICIGCVDHFLSSMFPANVKGLRLYSCLNVWNKKSMLDMKILVNYLKYFNFMIDLDYKNLKDEEILEKAYLIEVYKKTIEGELYTYEFSNNIDISFRYSNEASERYTSIGNTF